MGLAGVLAARELGPSGRGVITAAVALPMVFGWFSLLSINTAASVRIATGAHEALASMLAGAVAFCVVVGLVTPGRDGPRAADACPLR